MATGLEKLYVSQNGGGKATVTAQEVADLASGGGGSLVDLSDVDIGFVEPLGSDQVLLSYTDGGVTTWFNVSFFTIVASQVNGVLASYPGFGAGKVLAVNGTSDGFEWVAP